MPLLETLGAPSRQMAYTTVHHLPSSAAARDFVNRAAEVLDALRAESAAMENAFASGLAEARLRFAQVARGSLNAYLSTPIKSDTEDVQRTIREVLEKYSEQVFPPLKLGIQSAWSSRLVQDSVLATGRTKPIAPLKQMLARGKELVAALGPGKGKSSGAFFETNFILNGSLNLDLLEVLLGRVSGGSVGFGVHGNVKGEIFSILATAGVSDQTMSLWDVSLMPADPALEEDEMITNAEKLFASLAKELNLHHLSFWRKKFPANKESAYALRIRMIPEQKLLMESVKIVAEQIGNPLAVNLARNGALVVKEIIA